MAALYVEGGLQHGSSTGYFLPHVQRENGDILAARELVSTEAINPTGAEFNNIFDLLRPPHSFDQAARILEYHRAVAEAHGVKDPYFNFAGAAGHEPFVQEQYGSLSVRGGDIGIFSSLQMATIIHAQMEAYVFKGTMGKDFPLNNPGAVEDLTAVMIGGYGPGTYCAVIESFSDDEYIPIAVVRANIGNVATPLYQHVGDVHSNLPPLAALTFPTGLIDPKLAHTPCIQIASLSRFALNELALEKAGASKQEYSNMSRVLLAHMGQVLERLNESTSYEIRYLIIDTHLSSVKRMMQEYFGAVEIVGPDHRLPDNRPALEPTSEVSGTVLAHHYGTVGLNHNGHGIKGYKDQISVMVMKHEDFVNGGKRIL